MKLLRYGEVGVERPGVLLENGSVVDVTEHVGDFDQGFFSDYGIGRLRALIETSGSQLPTVELAGQRIGAPVAKPYQVLCIGLNYADHAAESGLAVPDEPVVFNKGPRTVVGPNDDVLIPPGSQKTDWEVELAVVIGKEARYLKDERTALDHIAGFAISNDISEREYQIERGGQWVKGKSCETFNPLGPWLVTPDEVDDVQALSMTLGVNGERMQDGSTETMVFSVAHIVWYLSQFMILEPGDLINTGTPPGVGLGMKPPRFLADGDVMELSISGLGHQRQQVRQATR
jgi:2-keto-4-pentenoate hydratase/2-oxohepta-3-ene-1,7-dioic acid hydratase in catechol pathway